eukprot:TRINITY_DN591_c0_g2_i1.p1 TRINITY_DN591_c0_g2~~TRINITY_DN591_c0_g2_i1.p1  ORF type:complete len:234 (+),score=26.38 TRINITY_DN591_c0_g2_i1:37-702(+)
MTTMEIAHATKTRAPPMHLLGHHSQPLRLLIQAMLSKQASRRPTPARALESPWLQDANAMPQAFAQTNLARAKTAPGGATTRGRHAFATVGITKSFIANLDSTDEPTGNESAQEMAAFALREVAQLSEPQTSAPTVHNNVVASNRFAPAAVQPTSARFVGSSQVQVGVPRVQFANQGGSANYQVANQVGSAILQARVNRSLSPRVSIKPLSAARIRTKAKW